MLFAIDPHAIDWDALDAARDHLRDGVAAKPTTTTTTAAATASEPTTQLAGGRRLIPTFARSMTARYRLWTADFRSAGGTRIYVISQVGASADENPGAFTVFAMAADADLARLVDVCTPTSHAAQQIYQTRVIGRTIVASNYPMVSSLESSPGEARPDILDALRASAAPVRVVWLPQQCRRGGLPSVSETAIDFGAAAAFGGAEWDKVLWMTQGYTPGAPTLEIVIKCQDERAARAMRDWVAQQAAHHKRNPPASGMNFAAALAIDLANDQVRITADATETERVYLLGNTFNIVP